MFAQQISRLQPWQYWVGGITHKASEGFMSISHISLVEIIRELKYPVEPLGMCYGFAVMSMQAIIANDLQTFDQRIMKIANAVNKNNLAPDEFAKKIREIEEKRVETILQYRKELLGALKKDVNMGDKEFYDLLADYKNKKNSFVEKFILQRANVDDVLSPEQRSLMDVRAFLQLISLYALPLNYSYLFEENDMPKFQNAEKTFSRGLPELLEATTERDDKKSKNEDNVYLIREPLVKKVNSFVGLYRLDELTEFFKQLRPPLPGFKPPVAFILGSANHAITVAYDSDKVCWKFIDANKLPSIEFKTEAGLASQVLSSLSKNEVTTFVTHMYCHKDQVNEVKQWFSEVSKKDEWKKLHEIENKETLTDSYGASLLWVSSESGDAALVKKLVNSKDPKVDMNCSVDGVTPLFVAVKRDRLEVVKALLANTDENEVTNIDPNRLSHKSTPLYIAARSGNLMIVEELLKNENVKKAINEPLSTQTYVNWFSPLNMAAKNGHREIVKALLENKELKLDAHPVFNVVMPLFEAAQNGHWRVVEVLLESPYFQMNARRALLTGETPLYIAASRGHWLVVEALLKNVDRSKIDAYQTSDELKALYIAAKKGHEKVVEALLNYKVDANKASEAGMTALYIAAKYGNQKVIEVLLDSEVVKVDPNLSSEGKTPLYIAAKNGHVGVVETLLTSQSMNTINSLVEEKRSVLLEQASIRGQEEELKKLFLEKGIPEDQILVELTALHVAIISGSREVVKSLLAAGCDIHKEMEGGISGLELATAMNLMDVIADFKPKRVKVSGRESANLAFFSPDKNDQSGKVVMNPGDSLMHAKNSKKSH